MFSPKIQFANKKGLLNLTAKPVFSYNLYIGRTLMSNDVQPTIVRSKSFSDSRYNVCGESVMAPANYIKKPKCISDNFFFYPVVVLSSLRGHAMIKLVFEIVSEYSRRYIRNHNRRRKKQFFFHPPVSCSIKL